MIFVPSTIETFDKFPDVQVGRDADAITVIPMGQGGVKLFIFVGGNARARNFLGGGPADQNNNKYF